VNEDSGLFLQSHFIVDALVVREDGKLAYYDNLTFPMAANHLFKDLDHYYILSLGFGESKANGLAAGRTLQDPRAYTSDNTHPVVRRFKKGVA